MSAPTWEPKTDSDINDAVWDVYRRLCVEVMVLAKIADEMDVITDQPGDDVRDLAARLEGLCDELSGVHVGPWDQP